MTQKERQEKIEYIRENWEKLFYAYDFAERIYSFSDEELNEYYEEMKKDSENFKPYSNKFSKALDEQISEYYPLGSGVLPTDSFDYVYAVRRAFRSGAIFALNHID